MKRNIILSLLIILNLFFITGCINNDKNEIEDVVQSNKTLGYISFYVPNDFTYQPDLRGLIYNEDERKIFVKGSYSDRSEAIIIDSVLTRYNNSIDNYINNMNSFLKDTDIKYEKIDGHNISDLYGREGYNGKSENIIIKNFTYIAASNGIIHTITVSGPESKQEELDKLITNEKRSFRLN